MDDVDLCSSVSEAVGAKRGDQVPVDFHRRNRCRFPSEPPGQDTRTRADLQDVVGRLQAERCEDPLDDRFIGQKVLPEAPTNQNCPRYRSP